MNTKRKNATAAETTSLFASSRNKRSFGGNFKTANSFYKLLMKFFDSFDVYKDSKKELVVKEYADFLMRWKKPSEAAALEKDLSVLRREKKLKRPDFPDSVPTSD